jgi:hypothetical protein
VRRQQRASGNHPEPPEVPEQRLPESIHWETACMTPNTKAQARAASVVLGLLWWTAVTSPTALSLVRAKLGLKSEPFALSSDGTYIPGTVFPMYRQHCFW